MDKILILQGVNELVFETYKISNIHQAGIIILMKAIIKNIKFLNQFFNKIINIFTNINIVLFKMHQLYLYRKYVLHYEKSTFF